MYNLASEAVSLPIFLDCFSLFPYNAINGPMFDTVQSEYLVEYFIRFGKSIYQILPTKFKCLSQLRSKQCRIRKTFTWQKFVMGKLPKFYTAKQCSLRYQVMEIYQPSPQLVETLGFSYN